MVEIVCVVGIIGDIIKVEEIVEVVKNFIVEFVDEVKDEEWWNLKIF